MKVLLRYLLLTLWFGLFIHTASAVYDPRLGRWLSRDPIGEDGGVNLYAYCGNDPVNRHDPRGLADDVSVADARFVEVLELAARLANNPTDKFLLQYQAEQTPIRHLTDGEPWALSIYQSGGAAGLAKYVATRDETLRMAGSMGIGAFKIAGGIAGMGASGFTEAGSWGLSSPVALPAFAGSAALFASGVRQVTTGDSVTLGGQLIKLGVDPESAAGLEFTLDGSMILAPGSLFRPITAPFARGKTAESLVTWVDEGGVLRIGGNPGMSPNAYKFQSGTPGARSNFLTGRSQAPYLDFTDEAGNIIGAKFDGVQGIELIDRKLNPFFSAKAVDEATRQAAVARYFGLQAVWELPTPTAVDAARRFMQINNISGITVRLAQ